jgi:hypothetical protein
MLTWKPDLTLRRYKCICIYFAISRPTELQCRIGKPRKKIKYQFDVTVDAETLETNCDKVRKGRKSKVVPVLN